MTTTPTRPDTPTPARRRSRRGVAMMLVILALGTGAVLATTYVTTKSVTSGVAANTVRSVRADWGARGAAEVASAILETDLDWRTAVADGVLVSDQSISGTNVTIECTDLHGAAPTPDTRQFLITTRSRDNGVEEVQQKLVRVLPDGVLQDAVDFSFDEFTIWADQSLSIDSTGAVGVWDESPEDSGLSLVKVGVGFTGTPGFVVDADAEVSDSALLLPADASSTLIGVAGGHDGFIDALPLPVHLPAIPFATPASLDALPPAAAGPITLSGVTQTLPPGYYPELTIDNGAKITLDGNLGEFAFGVLTVQNGSVLVINRAVRMKIGTAWNVTALSAVEHKGGGSSLEVYADGSILFDDGVVGFDDKVGNDPERDPFEMGYVDPDRIRIHMVGAPIPGVQTLTIQNNAVVAASLHAPDARVIIQNGAALFGRASGWSVTLQSNGMVLGDPSLDPGIAFTRLDGVLYDNLPALTNALANLSPAASADALTAEAEVVASIQAALLGGQSSKTGILGELVGGLSGGSGSSTTRRFPGRVFARDWPERVMLLEARSQAVAASGTGGAGGTGGGGGGGGVNGGLIDATSILTPTDPMGVQ